MKKLFMTTGFGLVYGASVWAQAPLYVPPSNLNVPCAPCVPCEPGTMGLPVIPRTPGSPGTIQPPGAIPGIAPGTLNMDALNSGQSPLNTGTAPTTAPNSQFAFESSPAAGTGSASSIAPNLMGDFIGARSLNISFSRLLKLNFPDAPLNTPDSGLVGPGRLALPRNGVLSLEPLPGMDVKSFGPFLLADTPTTQNLAPFLQNTIGNSAAIAPNDVFATQAILQSAFSGQPLNPQAVAMLPANVRALLPQIQAAVNQQLTMATDGLSLPNVTVSNVEGKLVPNGEDPLKSDLQYTALLTGQTVVPLPGSSSVVGRVKLSEDNNPMPRDRLIFNYDYFDNVPFTSTGVNVNRFQAGFEKTFLDGRASFEMRLPFAGTIASTTTQGFEVKDTELGNLRMALKYLWTQNPKVNFSSGLGVTLPTADDTIVNSILGNQLYRFENNSVTVEPFVAALFTPNDRLFGQAWSSVNFDTSGGDLVYDRNVFGGSGRADFIDLPILALDGQVGYWVVRRPTGLLRGMAPFVELHYNRVLGQGQISDTINNRAQSEGLQVNTVANTEFNITGGVTSQIGNNLFLTLGGSAPLLQNFDRSFDAQFGLRLNYLFGRSANPRTPVGYSPSSY